MTSRTENKRKKDKNSTMTKILLGILLLALWTGIAGGGYYYAKDYFDSTIKDVQETNAMHIQALKENIKEVEEGIEEVDAALDQADQKISSSKDTRQQLNNKIEQLDSQLKNLQKSLKILRETGDAEY
ncbi:MAG: hypothetical protein K9L17_09260 [Clostridiales bacterium]|nr:hypothetical protein [Clostridiales bacterium]MCF8022866.1 hypothetical protein [Clostridiales bacterium]